MTNEERLRFEASIQDELAYNHEQSGFSQQAKTCCDIRDALNDGAYALSRIAALEAAVKLRDDELRRVYALADECAWKHQNEECLEIMENVPQDFLHLTPEDNHAAELRGLAEEG